MQIETPSHKLMQTDISREHTINISRHWISPGFRSQLEDILLVSFFSFSHSLSELSEFCGYPGVVLEKVNPCMIFLHTWNNTEILWQMTMLLFSKQWMWTKSLHEFWVVGSQCCGTRGAVGVRCLAQGSHLSRGKVERALVIHSPHRQFLLDLRLEPMTFKLQDWLSTH